MDEVSRYAVGIDVGTSAVRAVAASVSSKGEMNVIGYAEVPNSGMRRGVVANLTGPSQAIMDALAKVGRMGGYDAHSAMMSINGAQILSTLTEGMIAVGATEHEINQSDMARVEDVAMQGKIPANQVILDLMPLEFVLDGQGGIKEAVGMSGSRLEMKANVVSTLAPNFDNLQKVAEMAQVTPERLVPSVVAAARAVLSERQRENGVAVVDMGAATTGVAIFEENELQYVGVVPIGSNNITNDLAVMLAIDPEVAEEIKRRFATGSFGESEGQVTIRWRGKELRFERDQIDEVVQARLEEIFRLVQKEISKAHYDRRLPEGIVLTGGGSRMRELDKFVRLTLNMPVKVGVPGGLAGVAEAVYKPEYAAAVGLMEMSAESAGKKVAKKTGQKAGKKGSGGVFAGIKKFFSKF